MQEGEGYNRQAFKGRDSGFLEENAEKTTLLPFE